MMREYGTNTAALLPTLRLHRTSQRGQGGEVDDGSGLGNPLLGRLYRGAHLLQQLLRLAILVYSSPPRLTPTSNRHCRHGGCSRHDGHSSHTLGVEVERLGLHLRNGAPCLLRLRQRLQRPRVQHHRLLQRLHRLCGRLRGRLRRALARSLGVSPPAHTHLLLLDLLQRPHWLRRHLLPRHRTLRRRRLRSGLFHRLHRLSRLSRLHGLNWLSWLSWLSRGSRLGAGCTARRSFFFCSS